MPLHPLLAEKLSSAVEPAPPLALTRRDVQLPAIQGKAHSVIGMRRAGKSTFLRQLLDARRERVPPERAIYLGFDDDRLAGLEVDQLGFLLEEYYRRYQVCADPSDPETLGRELRGLAAAAEEHAGATRRLLVLDRDALSQVRAADVEVQPAYEWLLHDA